MNKTVFFRDDDVQDCDVNFKKFIGLFLWHRIPVHLAVIPGKMTVRCGAFLRQCLKKHPDLIEIGQHGYKHLNYSHNPKSKYEFGPRRTYAQQKKDIVMGKSIISQITKDALIFTPPWHGFDKNTLKIISELGFSGISLDRKSKTAGGDHPVKNIMTGVYLNKKGLNGWFLEEADVILNEVRAVQGIMAGIQAHHNEFKGDKEFKVLNGLLSKLRKIPEVRFCKLSEASS